MTQTTGTETVEQLRSLIGRTVSYRRPTDKSGEVYEGTVSKVTATGRLTVRFSPDESHPNGSYDVALPKWGIAVH